MDPGSDNYANDEFLDIGLRGRPSSAAAAPKLGYLLMFHGLVKHSAQQDRRADQAYRTARTRIKCEASPFNATPELSQKNRTKKKQHQCRKPLNWQTQAGTDSLTQSHVYTRL